MALQKYCRNRHYCNKSDFKSFCTAQQELPFYANPPLVLPTLLLQAMHAQAFRATAGPNHAIKLERHRSIQQYIIFIERNELLEICEKLLFLSIQRISEISIINIFE